MSTARTQVSSEVGEILRAGIIDDGVFRLPHGQLEPRLYRRVAEALGALGGAWDKRVDGFPVGANFDAALKDALETGIAIDRDREEAFDPTPGPGGIAHPGPQEWMSFTMLNGRHPFAADSPPIWAYSGWLRFMVLQLEDLGLQAVAAGAPADPAYLPRWHYVTESKYAGHVLDKPLPQTRWGGHGAGEKASRIFMQWCELLHGGRSLWERMRLVMEFLAWGFGLIDAPPKISEREALDLYAGREDGRSAIMGVNSRALLDLYRNPCDLFGYTLSQSIGKGWNPNAFFPTPESIVTCMVEMTMHDTKDVDQRGLTVCDPCVGTGRMLIYAGQKSMRLFGMDIDYMMVLATKINLAFWCPWGLYDWPDEYFGIVKGGVPGRTQLTLFARNITIDKKNQGRPRAEVEMEVWQNNQMGLFGRIA